MLVQGLGAQACSQDQSLGTGSNRKFQLSILGVVRETELGVKADFSHLSQGTGASPDCTEKSLDMGVIRGSSISPLAFGLVRDTGCHSSSCSWGSLCCV